MRANHLLLERSGFERCERKLDDKVVMMRSSLRSCSGGLGFACVNGDVIRAAIEAHLKTVPIARHSL